jgi:Uma2 family endonuclease
MKLAKPTVKRPTRRKSASDTVSLVLRKPADESALRDLAEKLNGRAVPGLRMTEAEYAAWADSATNSEWVDGEVVLMPPVSAEQDDLQSWLNSILREFLEVHNLGRRFGPEFSVRLARERRRRVPDLLVVLKHRIHLVRPNHLEGAPDVAFEIVGPESVSRDWREKYSEYQSAGVREYWVIDPTTRQIEASALRGKKYHRIAEDDDGRIVSRVLKGFFLKSDWLWKQPLPRVSTVLRELGVSNR